MALELFLTCPVPQELAKLERREYPFSKFDCKKITSNETTIYGQNLRLSKSKCEELGELLCAGHEVSPAQDE